MGGSDTLFGFRERSRLQWTLIAGMFNKAILHPDYQFGQHKVLSPGLASRGAVLSKVEEWWGVCMCVCACGEVDEGVFRRWDDMWLCLSRAETHSDIISPAPGQLMWYLLSPWPPNPVSSGRSHLQCKTISAYLKRQFLQSIDYKLLLENGIILTKGYSLSSWGPEGNPSFFNNLYV